METQVRPSAGHRRGGQETAAWIAKEKRHDMLNLAADDTQAVFATQPY
jgi:hypothetical protein